MTEAELGPLEALYESPALARSELTPPLGRLYGGGLGFAGPTVYANFVATLDGTMVPSDSRSAAPDFTFGLYGSPCRDDGRGDGPLVFHATPSTRAALPTPPGPTMRFGSSIADVAFAVT